MLNQIENLGGSNVLVIDAPQDRTVAAEATDGRSEAEIEFLAAIQEYKRQSGRLFPTWSEVLEVAMSLGYAKAS
jgi:hypothetical protein